MNLLSNERRMTATIDLQSIAVPLHVWNDTDNPFGV